MTLEWLAGFFDGEGCISSARGVQRSPNPRVTLGNTHQGVMDEVKAFLGERCKKGSYRTRTKNDGRRTMYLVYFDCAADVQLILELLAPHLHVKQEQAFVAIEMARRINERIGCVGTSRVISDRELLIRHKLDEALSRLNGGSQ